VSSLVQGVVNEEDVNRSEKRDRDASPATILIAALSAAIAGFGTVYVSFAPPDNGRFTLWPRQQTDRAPAEPLATGMGGGASRGPLAGLNRGAMAAFVAKAKPQALPAITFTDPQGGAKSLADWRGKVVLLNVWATWCAPCREEMPTLDKLEALLGGKDFEVVAVNIDRGQDDKPKTFLAEAGATHLRLYRDPPGKLFSTVKAVGMPTTLLIDREGREIGRLVGPADWDSPEALALLKAAIAAPPSA
jgi:thiol-disulfide isomerase/thioredoxin